MLFLATVAVYAPVLHFDFVNFDDPEYVTANPHVPKGLTPDGIVWALTSTEAANWFPVTRISHLLDGQLFGMHSGMHHLTNVVFHALAALLLFAFLDRATRARWPSAMVALLFALHPLHVESVAWVSERKDVLSAFFWFLALLLYVRYTEQKSAAPCPPIVAVGTSHIFRPVEPQDKLMADAKPNDFPVWRTPAGEPVSCVEKIKVLNENLAELRSLAQDALEDAVLMGCDERQVREVLGGIVAGLVNPYRQ